MCMYVRSSHFYACNNMHTANFKIIVHNITNNLVYIWLYNLKLFSIIGALNGGMGYTKLNKVLASLDVTPLNPTTYKTREKEVGHVVEELVQMSCINATKEERELTIKNPDELKKLL